MKKQNVLFVLLILLITSSVMMGQRIFRPMDPSDPLARYGKSPYSGSPFFYFGTTSFNFKIAHSQYNTFLSYVDAAFTSWNNAGPVKFSRTTSGLTLTAQAQDYDSYGPAWSTPSWNGSTYELIPSSGSVVLNTICTWSNTQQQLNANPPILDVQSMVVHEVGHIHGLAHPLTNSYTHDDTAPTMAGGDNAYFDNTLDVRSLETEDIYGTEFLQLRVPTLYSDLRTALNIATGISIGYVHIMDDYTIPGDITVPPGISLIIEPNVTINLGNYSVISTGGMITIESGVTQNYTELLDGSAIKGLYSSLNTAISDAISGQTINVYNSSSLTANISIPDGITVNIRSGATVNFNGYSIKSTGGTITIETGVTQNYIELLDGSVVKGLYSSLNTAVNDAVSGQTINVFNSSNLTANVSIPTGITLNIKSSSTLNLNGYKLLLAGGSVVVESGANFPYAKLLNSSNVTLAYYPTLESAISDAQSGYTVQLPSITYNGNISLTNKSSVNLKGAGTSSTTINGNITITNSDYALVGGLSMGDFKQLQ